MARITFDDGTTKEVSAQDALRLKFVKKGLREGTPKLLRYLERVTNITFERPPEETPVHATQNLRLPYKD